MLTNSKTIDYIPILCTIFAQVATNTKSYITIIQNILTQVVLLTNNITIFDIKLLYTILTQVVI